MNGELDALLVSALRRSRIQESTVADFDTNVASLSSWHHLNHLRDQVLNVQTRRYAASMRSPSVEARMEILWKESMWQNQIGPD
jgi:hypothetical protein